jgi:hypothetical protein
MRLWMKWPAWLCLSLMVWVAALESAHNHPNQTESSCAICLAAHSASPTLSSGQSAPAFAAVGLLQEEAVVAQVRPEFSDLEIRGPPVLL